MVEIMNKYVNKKIDWKVIKTDLKDLWISFSNVNWESYQDYGEIGSDFKKYNHHPKTKKIIKSRSGKWKDWDELTAEQKIKLYFLFYEKFGDKSIKFEKIRCFRWWENVLFYEETQKFNHMRFWHTLSNTIKNDSHFFIVDSLQGYNIGARLNYIFKKIKSHDERRRKSKFWKYPHFVYYKLNFYDQTPENMIGKIWCLPYSLFSPSTIDTKLSLKLYNNPSKIIQNVFCPRGYGEMFDRLTSFEILVNKQICLQIKLLNNPFFYRKNRIKTSFYSSAKSAHSAQNFYSITKKRGVLFGLTQKQYASKLNGWSKKIKNKHNNLCQICFKQSYASHHLLYAGLYPKLSLNLNNGIALCHLCHQQTHGKKLNSLSHKQHNKQIIPHHPPLKNHYGIAQ